MARKERCYVLEIGCVRDHVHVLVRLHPTVSVARLVRRLKGASSAVADQERHGVTERLYWATGYAIQSVSLSHLDGVRRHLRSQPDRHPQMAIPGWQDRLAEYDIEGLPGRTLRR